jgi:hypothetical protein
VSPRTENHVVAVVDRSPSGPSDASRDPLARTVAEVADELGRREGERVVLDATGVCGTALGEFVDRVRSGRSLRPLHSLRLEPARLLAVLAQREDVPATILAAARPEQVRRVAESWSRHGSPVSVITVSGGPERFVVDGVRLSPGDDGGEA